MKIFVEGCLYSRKDVEGVLPESCMLFKGDCVKIEHVGYYRNPKCDDFVFFLPKVLVNAKGRVFCLPGDPKLAEGFAPSEIIDSEKPTADGRELADEQKKFLYEFAVWIYRSLALYLDKNPDSDAVWYEHEESSGGFRRQYVTHTLLDVILALRRFHQENSDYFLFKIQERHSGLNKINWRRTISKCAPTMSDGAPVYLNPTNRRREVDFDEELLVIFYSILRHVSNKYGFVVRISVGYNLISETQFENYVDGYGCTRLRQIKYKYFSDRDLALWELCYAFFDRAHKAVVENSREEYLLARKYNVVFEAMIDDLIGDGELESFKTLRDDKEIDHLYVDDSVTHADKHRSKSLFIADSKYYGIGESLGDTSIHKQFTYARNMLQLNLDLFLDGDDVDKYLVDKRAPFVDKGIKLLRDPVSEGYDVIPNFFVSATLNEKFDYDLDDLKQRDGDGGAYLNRHFDNRLFDRDTLILTYFDVNFLYVLKLYAQNDAGLKEDWRRNAREKFRASVRKLLMEHFTFKALLPHDGMTQDDADKFLHDNFHATLGKVYAPYPKVDGLSVYSLALENPKNIITAKRHVSEAGLTKLAAAVAEENESVLHLLKQAFYMVDVELGEDPKPKLLSEKNGHPMTAILPDMANSVQITRSKKGSLAAAVRRYGWCPCPVEDCKNPDAVRLLVIPFSSGAYKFKVDVSKGVKKGLDLETLMSLWNNDMDFSGVEMPGDKYYAWFANEV